MIIKLVGVQVSSLDRHYRKRHRDASSGLGYILVIKYNRHPPPYSHSAITQSKTGGAKTYRSETTFVTLMPPGETI